MNLIPFDASSGAFADALDVYCDVFAADKPASREFIARYAGYPDFRGVVARAEDGSPVGMGFGITAFKGNWWFDRVAEEVGADHPALQDAWCLVELGVRKDWRRKGLASEIHDYLLQSQPHPRAVLSTQVDNQPARNLYASKGWRCIHDGFVFSEGQEPFVVMAREHPSG